MPTTNATQPAQRTFNGILAWDSFFHRCPEDQRQKFPIFRKHAASRAALMFTSGTSHGIAMGSLGGEPLCHASLDPDEYRALLDAGGFEVVAHVVEDPTCRHRTVWLAQLREYFERGINPILIPLASNSTDIGPTVLKQHSLVRHPRFGGHMGKGAPGWANRLTVEV